MTSGCATTKKIEFPAAPVTLGDFVQQIKHEVGAFEQEKAALGPPGSCGQDFNLLTKKVTVTVATVNKSTTEANAGAEIPLGTGLSIGPSASASQTITGTQTVKFSVYPQPLSAGGSKQIAPPSPLFEGTPLKDALINLYKGFLANSDYQPCIRFGDPDKQDNTLDYGFKVEQSRTVGAKAKIFLFSLGASNKRERSIDNTLKVTFQLEGQAATGQ
jgi:hypothetical protein